jgi:hypothetical protein
MVLSPSDSTASANDNLPVDQASAANLLEVSICSHILITQDIDEANYGQWRCFFDSTLGKFGLKSHVQSPTPSEDCDDEWRMVDSCIVN